VSLPRSKAAILERFGDRLQADRAKHAPDWLVGWHYQQVRAGKYPADYPQDFTRYEGPADLVRWFNWGRGAPVLNYLPLDRLKPLIEQAEARDRSVLERLGIGVEPPVLRAFALLDAQDYLFPRLYPRPERHRLRRVLDFGAGFGRQANLLLALEPGATYVAMDAIALPYCLQHVYLGALAGGLADYVEEGRFALDDTATGCHHLPTWRHDLLPDGYFDLAICSQVLPELSPLLAVFVVELLRRVLRPGGVLYIRDHGAVDWNPSGIELARYLEASGFWLEFRPMLRDRVDLHGLPRIWRKPEA